MNWISIILKIIKILPDIVDIFVANNPKATKTELKGFITGHINLLMPVVTLANGDKDIKGVFDSTTQNIIYQAIENELVERGIK